MQIGGMTMTTTAIPRRPDRPALRTALEAAGFLVFEASEGGRDRERLREFWAALILFDLPMPRMGGLEVLRRLRGAGDDEPEAIIVTQGRIPDTTTAVRLGAIDVLTRPMGSEAVRGAVDSILRPNEGPPPGAPVPRILVAVEPLLLDLIRVKRALDCREFDAAERLLYRALALAPDSAVAHHLMGVLHLRLGEHNAAYHSFKAALRADPHYEPAREGLGRQCQRLGLDVLRSPGRATDRRGRLDPFGLSNDRIDPADLTRPYDRPGRYLGLDSGKGPVPGSPKKQSY